jgi:hypothetical protein
VAPCFAIITDDDGGYFTGLAGPCGDFQTQADMATLGACTTSTSW